ncbi:hypothetical protein [Gimesia chilikensis]|uniref:hypothetical protein n=1 Tax=Gimesia chilikensis TaxID=2605989 RepID=UPI0011A4C7B3|nr:hypothetical protein [Gimesia chilikensis]
MILVEGFNPAFGFCITIFAGCAGLKGCSLAGSAGFHGLNAGTPDGGGLGFLLKLLLTAESLGNGFIFDSPMTAFLSLSHKPSHCRRSRSASHS